MIQLRALPRPTRPLPRLWLIGALVLTLSNNAFGASPPTLNFTTGKTVNGVFTLNWSTTNAKSCVASAAWMGMKATSGTAKYGPYSPGSLVTYRLTCTGDGGTVERKIGGTVIPWPTVTLAAAPTSVASGGSSQLTWASTNSTACTAAGGWSGTKVLNGKQSTGARTATTSYQLTCSGAGGSKTASAILTVTKGTAPALTLSASPTSVASGSTSRLTWTATNATSCTASGAWSGTKAISGTQTTSALTANANYTLACTGSGGSISRTATVTVSAAAAPTVTLTSSPTTVQPGASSQLAWSSTNATSCTASGSWSGSKGTSGTQSTGALNANASYTLTCTGTGGSGARTAAVTVSSSAPTLTLTASPTSVQSGSASQLTWSTTNATSCAASGSWSGSRGTSGTQTTGTLTANSSFTLTCAGAAGNVARTATVGVTAGAASVSISANPPGVARNGTTTLTWTGTNVTSCNASGAWTGTKTPSGTQSAGPLTQDATYSLSCSGTAGNAVAMTTVSLREAVLTWQAPSKNTDGSNLTNLAGYKVYYGSASRSYTQNVSVSGAATLQRTVTLSPGTWYFAVAAVDAQGRESAPSGEVSKIVR